jgi:hypothetical protein
MCAPANGPFRPCIKMALCNCALVPRLGHLSYGQLVVFCCTLHARQNPSHNSCTCMHTSSIRLVYDYMCRTQNSIYSSDNNSLEVQECLKA